MHELTNGRGADVLFEFAGSTRAFGEGVEMAAPKARYVMAGAVGGMPQPVPVPLLIKRNLTVIGALGAAIGAYADALEFIERFDDRFTWDRLLGPGRYSLEDAPWRCSARVIWRRRRRSSSRAASAEDIAGFVLGGLLPEPPPYESVRCQFRISDGAKPGANISRPRMWPRARARRTAA